MKTFESLVKSPSKEPTSVLTKPGDHLIETQVLEVYDELSMNQDKFYKVELEGNSGGPTHVKLDEDEENESLEEAGKRERLQLKLVDMGEMKLFFMGRVLQTGLMRRKTCEEYEKYPFHLDSELNQVRF